MEEAQKLIEELKCLVKKDSNESTARMDEIAEWFRTHKTKENMDIMYEFLCNWLEGIEIDVTRFVEKVKEEKKEGS